MKIAGCILAGGRSSRFGSDKALVTLGGKTLLEHAIKRLRPQVLRTVISTNSNCDEYRRFGMPVIKDMTPGFDGPLAGVLAGLNWTDMNDMDALVSVAVDTPFFPLDLVAKLRGENGITLAVADSPSGLHPTFALWPRSVSSVLRDWLSSGESRKMTAFLKSQSFTKVFFEQTATLDPFFNINTPQDLRIASAENVGRLAK